MSPAKTPAQRQADLKARRKAAGFVKISVWAVPDAVPVIRDLEALLARNPKPPTLAKGVLSPPNHEARIGTWTLAIPTTEAELTLKHGRGA